MASSVHFQWLTRNIGNWANTFEERMEEKERWVVERLTFGKEIRNQLPMMGQLIISRPGELTEFVERTIIPENGISQKGYVNEILIPGQVSEIQIDGNSLSPFFGIRQDVRVGYATTQVEIYDHSGNLLLSPKKLKVIPYLDKHGILA